MKITKLVKSKPGFKTFKKKELSFKLNFLLLLILFSYIWSQVVASIWDAETVIYRCFLQIKISVLKNFAKLTGKQLYWSLFLIKLQAWRTATLPKRDSETGIFLSILRKSQKQLFYRTPLDDCFWRCHVEFVVVICIVYPAAITLKLKEHLEICG